jgi:L-asparaginase
MTQRRVLLLYTGGTIGMTMSESMHGSLGPPQLTQSGLKKRVFELVPELRDLARCDLEVLFNLDSGHMGPAEWLKMAEVVRARWDHYDGIVILHGTDTLSYSASALSFLLEPCRIPVILTGAQRPLAALRSDARQNLVSSVEIAAQAKQKKLNRVCVFFGDTLFIGNRVRKRSAFEFDAFESPQAGVLAVVGTQIRYSDVQVTRKRKPVKILPSFSHRVLTVVATPAFPSESVSDEVLNQLDAMLMIVFPSATAPTHLPGFIELLRRARARNLPVIIATEGATRMPGFGAHPADYEAGRRLLDEGCFWAGEMTPECAYVKASLILGQPQGRKHFAKWWKRELSDEGCGC